MIKNDFFFLFLVFAAITRIDPPQVKTNKEHIKLYSCFICGQTTCYRQNLNRHLLKHQTEHMKYTCDICGRSYNRRDNYKAHFKTHNKKMRNM